MLNSRYRFLTITSLSFLKSITPYSTSVPFLNTNIYSNAAKELDFRIYYLLSSLRSYLSLTYNSRANFIYSRLNRIFAPSYRDIL